MLDILYRRRLEQDLDRWVNHGWVSADGAAAIRASLGGGGRVRTAAVLGFLGVTLIAAAAITFVAANWSEIARPVRLAILVAGMATCYVLAGWLYVRQLRWFSDAAVFLGAVLYGASIVLVAQSYHLSGDYPDALLMWGAGALLAAVLGQTRAALALAIVVLGLWSWYEVTEFGWRVHWPFLVAWALCAGLAATWNWIVGLNLVLLALVGWLGTTVIRVADALGWSAGAAVALLVALAAFMFAVGVALATLLRAPRIAAFGPPAAIYALIAFLALLIALQPALTDGDPTSGSSVLPLGLAASLALATGVLMAALSSSGQVSRWDAAGVAGTALAAIALAYIAEGRSEVANGLGFQMALGLIVLGAATWASTHGQTTGRRTIAALGFTAFAAQVLYLYFVTFGTLLDTALFFLLGGLLMIALAVAMTKMQRRVARPDAEATP